MGFQSAQGKRKTMPLYDFMCDNCNLIKEVLLPTAKGGFRCPICSTKMRKLPPFPAMVKVKGSGGYPSRRKMVKGTAPFSG